MTISFPMKRVHMELTSICNFDCTFCPKSKMTRKNGTMDTALAKKILDELAAENITEKVTFHVMGEPFLHPDFFSILSYAKEKNLPVGITTNGSYLTKESSKKLAALKVDQINISLQTPSKEAYETRKSKNIDYDTYCENILTAIDQLIVHSPTTKIKIHFLNTKFNRSVRETVGEIDIISSTPELRKVFSYWAEKLYHLPSVKSTSQLTTVLQHLQKISINKWNVLEVYPNVFFETYLLDSWGDGLRKGASKKGYLGYCSALTDHFGILWNGDLVLCCKDFDGKTKMANLQGSSIIEILQSKEVTAILNGFKRYHVVHPYCQKCLGGSSVIASAAKQLGSILFFDMLKGYFYHQKKLY